MAHDINAKIWTVDTSATGVVSANPVQIKSIFVTWKSGSAGSVLIQEATKEGTTGLKPILTAKTLGATSAGWDQMTQQFTLESIFQNVWLTTATNIDSIYILVN